MPKNQSKIVACLDMGTTKVVCLIAAVDHKGITILGYGHKGSKGIIASAISDMKLAEKSISSAVSDAEKMAGFNIDRLVVGLSGCQTLSQRQEVSNKIVSEMVKGSDITGLANKVRFEYKRNNREVIHLIPLQYRIDDSSAVQNPRYMSGETLSARFHIVSTSFTTIKNIENCLKRCQLSVNNYISESYASALSALSDNELNLGTLVIDIGGSNTSFSVIVDNRLVHVGSFSIAGIHITRDIATVLNIDFETAEKIKNLNNSLVLNPLEERDLIRVAAAEESLRMVSVSKSDLRDIIHSRVEEIMESVKVVLDKSGYGSFLISNVVLTGGVSAIIGIEKVAADVFDKPVRIGFPQKINNLPEELDDPSFCSVTGMLVFLKNIYMKERIKDGFESKGGIIKKVLDKLMSL